MAGSNWHKLKFDSGMCYRKNPEKLSGYDVFDSTPERAKKDENFQTKTGYLYRVPNKGQKGR